MVSTLIVAGVAVLIQGGLAIYTSGKLAQKVTGHGEWLNKLDNRVDEHETRISHLEGALN